MSEEDKGSLIYASPCIARTLKALSILIDAELDPEMVHHHARTGTLYRIAVPSAQSFAAISVLREHGQAITPDLDTPKETKA